MMTQRLDRAFFERPTLEVARRLLGQRLVKLSEGGTRLSGFICETEAYIGEEDDGCHAKSGLTPRNRPMWGPAGYSYVYFTYGMHWMFNVVTEHEGYPAAVLIRAIYPDEGRTIMQDNRHGQPFLRWADGPAKLCQALGINGTHNGLDLCGRASTIFIENAEPIAEISVTIGPRVGLNRVTEPWKSIPWRFRVPYENCLAGGVK